MKLDFIQSSKVTLWRGEECLSMFSGVFSVGLYRIMWEGKQSRIIIYTNLPHGELNLADGDTIELRAYRTGRIDLKSNGAVLYRFENLELARQWIPKPVPLEYNNHLIAKFYEYECDIVELVDSDEVRREFSKPLA